MQGPESIEEVFARGTVIERIQVLFLSNEPEASFDKERLIELLQPVLITIATATTAQECFQFLQAQQVETPVLVISDILIPEMDGLALLKVIEKKFPWVKFYICSNQTARFHRRNLARKGALRFFGKPLDWSDLKVALAEDFAEELSIAMPIE